MEKNNKTSDMRDEQRNVHMCTPGFCGQCSSCSSMKTLLRSVSLLFLSIFFFSYVTL